MFSRPPTHPSGPLKYENNNDDEIEKLSQIRIKIANAELEKKQALEFINNSNSQTRNGAKVLLQESQNILEQSKAEQKRLEQKKQKKEKRKEKRKGKRGKK